MAVRPVRKANRLESYDYSVPGYYFVTFCTENHVCILGQITPCSEYRQGEMVLNPAGEIVRQAILNIPNSYPGVLLDKFVIMPNHVHLILALQEGKAPLPSISRIVQQTKGLVTKRLGKQIWQIHFHDHIIRGEADYREIWEYIDNNPAKWALDRYYQP